MKPVYLIEVEGVGYLVQQQSNHIFPGAFVCKEEWRSGHRDDKKRLSEELSIYVPYHVLRNRPEGMWTIDYAPIVAHKMLTGEQIIV